MFTISINANSLSDLKAKMIGALNDLGVENENVLVKSDEGAVARDTKPTAKPAATKTAKPPKEKVTAKKEVDPFEEENEVNEDKAPPLKPIKVSKELVVAALKEVNSSKGLEATRNVLQEFGVQRSSELKETDYAKVIEACKAAL